MKITSPDGQYTYIVHYYLDEKRGPLHTGHINTETTVRKTNKVGIKKESPRH